MKEITGKSKFEIKKLPHRIVINEKEVIGEKQLRENSITFFVNTGTKLASKNKSVKHIF